MKRETIVMGMAIGWLALVGAPGATRAQGSVAVGDEVRATWSPRIATPGYLPLPRTEVMEVSGLQYPHLTGRTRGGELVVLDARRVQKLERRIGTKPASSPAMVAGSAAGFAAGFLIGAMSSPAVSSAHGQSAVDRGLVTGVLIGSPAGALIAFIASRSRGIYEEVGSVRFNLLAAPTASGGVGVSLSAGRAR